MWAADRAGGTLRHAVFAHERPVWRIAYTADGRRLFSVGEDRVVKAWDAVKMVESTAKGPSRKTIRRASEPRLGQASGLRLARFWARSPAVERAQRSVPLSALGRAPVPCSFKDATI